MDRNYIASELVQAAKEVSGHQRIAFSQKELEKAFDDAKKEFKKRMKTELSDLVNQPAWRRLQKDAQMVSTKAEEFVRSGKMTEADVHEELVLQATIIMMEETQTAAEALKPKSKLASVRVAGLSLLDEVLPMKDVANLRKHADKQTYALARDVYRELMKRFEPSSAENEAINRLRNAAGSSNEGVIRNQVFKAAHSLGMKLPSMSF